MKNLESYFDERYSNTNDYRAKKKDLCIQILNGITDSAKSYKILDIGCGSGFYTSQMVKRNREVTGTDISQIAIDQLPKEIKRIRSDVSMKLPFDDNSFEVIMLMDILELIPDLQLFKNELKRITKKDAIIIGCVPNANFLLYLSLQFLTGKSISQIFYGTHTRFYSKKYLYKEFNSEGFKIKRFIGITRIKNFFFIKKNPLCLFSRDFVFQIALKNE